MTKTLVFGLSPLLTSSLALQGFVIGLCTILGAYTDRWIVPNTPIRVPTAFMECFVLCGTGNFLFKSATGFDLW